MAYTSPESVQGNGVWLLLASVLLFSAYFVLDRIRDYHRLRHFKGPATTGISWWWHSKAVISGRAHEYYGDVTEKYGT
jgi:hypothetical protein